MYSQDLISDSPHCLPYNSYDVSSENFVLDQLKIPLLAIFLSSSHLSAWYYMDTTKRNSVLVTRERWRIKNRNTETGDYCSWITFFFFKGKQESKQNLYLAPTIASAHPLTSWGKSTKKPLTMDWKKEWNEYLSIIISIKEINLVRGFELIWFP